MEDKHRYPAEEFQAACASQLCDVQIIKDCDHFYNGKEELVANLIADWLEQKI